MFGVSHHASLGNLFWFSCTYLASVKMSLVAREQFRRHCRAAHPQKRPRTHRRTHPDPPTHPPLRQSGCRWWPCRSNLGGTPVPVDHTASPPAMSCWFRSAVVSKCWPAAEQRTSAWQRPGSGGGGRLGLERQRAPDTGPCARPEYSTHWNASLPCAHQCFQQVAQHLRLSGLCRGLMRLLGLRHGFRCVIAVRRGQLRCTGSAKVVRRERHAQDGLPLFSN